MQRKSVCESMDSNPSKTALAGHHGDVSNSVSYRKASIATSGRTPSISSQPRPSLVGLIASKRFASRLSSKAFRKRSLFFSDGSRLSHGPKKEPTYRMEPDRKFLPDKVEACIKDVLESRLQDFSYSSKPCATMCKIIGDEIKFQVKGMNFDRYKIICSVSIGQLKDQGTQVVSRCAWDDSLDRFASYTYRNDDIFCTAIVFGVYAE